MIRRHFLNAVLALLAGLGLSRHTQTDSAGQSNGERARTRKSPFNVLFRGDIVEWRWIGKGGKVRTGIGTVDDVFVDTSLHMRRDELDTRGSIGYCVIVDNPPWGAGEKDSYVFSPYDLKLVKPRSGRDTMTWMTAEREPGMFTAKSTLDI